MKFRRAVLFPLIPLLALGATFSLRAEDPPSPAPTAPPKEEERKDFSQEGAAHLAEILTQPWAKNWTGATLREIRLVQPKPGVAFPTKLPAAWHARIAGPEGKSGYLLWDEGKEGRLIEFALDDRLSIYEPNARALGGVTVLQQFPMPGKDGGKAVASGCVPTAGASVFSFWLKRGGVPSKPAAAGDAEKTSLQDLTRSLRGRISMMAIPDKDGFTENGMDLAGANPAELAKSLQAEADERQLALTVKFGDFAFDLLKSEINAGRPALLSCVVRVPHKPELSWGHEVAATGWLELGGTRFAGILDNFYPVKNPATLRWIREDAFQSLITVKPAAGN